MNLASATIVKAIGWSTCAKIAQQLFQFGLSIALMRLLGPQAFGLIGMIVVFSGFAMIISDFGLSSALVQRKDLREEHCSTIFWLNLGVGGLLMMVFCGAAPLIASFYEESLLRPITYWLSLSFVITAPGMVPRALLQRDLRFDIIAKVQIASLLVSGGVAVSIATLGGGVWSLVTQQLVSATLASMLYLYYGHWYPKRLWSGEAFRELIGFGAGLTGFNIINYWARSADKLLIGKFLSTEALGLYSRAYSLMLLPLTQIIAVLGPVMFPAMSSIQDDKPRVKRTFLRAMKIMTFLAFPIMLGLMVVANPFVLGLYGEKWAEIIPLIQVLCFVGIIQTVCNPTGWIYKSQGRTDWMFWWGLAGSGFLVLSIIVGMILGGLQKVALAYLVGNLIIAIPCILIPGRLIEMSVGEVWRCIRGNLLCAVGMAVLVSAVGKTLPSEMAPLLRLHIQVGVGAIAYGLLGWLFQLSVLKEILAARMYLTARKTKVELEKASQPFP